MGHPTLPEELIEHIVEDLFEIASRRGVFLARGVSGEYYRLPLMLQNKLGSSSIIS
jgi:hypothetical protein